MISKKTLKLLKWMYRHDEWMTDSKISTDFKRLDRRSLKALADGNYLKKRYSESESSWAEYRISDLGIAYLEGSKHARKINIREWLSFGLSVSAIVISIIALLMQAEIL